MVIVWGLFLPWYDHKSNIQLGWLWRHSIELFLFEPALCTLMSSNRAKPVLGWLKLIGMVYYELLLCYKCVKFHANSPMGSVNLWIFGNIHYLKWRKMVFLHFEPPLMISYWREILSVEVSRWDLQRGGVSYNSLGSKVISQKHKRMHFSKKFKLVFHPLPELGSKKILAPLKQACWNWPYTWVFLKI